MSASLSIPPSEMTKLRTQLRNYAKYSKKSEAEIVNDKAADWAFKAVAQTDRANPQQIAAELGQVGTKVSVSRKTGAFRRGKAIFKDDSLAARIINSRLAKKGEKLLFGAELKKAVIKFVAARKKSSTFVAAGWLSAARKLKSVFSSFARVVGAPKGTARRAPDNSLMPTAYITNTANKGEPRAAKVSEVGLVKAIPIMIADMQTYIERKMKEAARKAGV